MTAPELTDRDRLAAEHALRLLEGEELLTARGLVASDPAFAADVAQWEERLAPLHDTVPAVGPGADLWPRIEAAITDAQASADSSGSHASGDIVALRKQVRRWQVASMLSAAAAIALAFFTFVQPAQQRPVGTPEAPLMANIPIGETQLRLAVTYVPGRNDLLVSASGLTADGVHDHELWLVMPEGAPRSLGVVAPGENRRVPLDPQLARAISAGSQMVLTREPLGGAPAGGKAGPVVAEGRFLQS